MNSMKSTGPKPGGMPKAGLATKALVFCALLLGASIGWSSDNSLTSRTYNTIMDIQELMAEERNDDALRELQKLRENVTSDTMDEAMVLQMMGYAEVARQNYPQAIEYMRASLDLDKLPEQMKYELGYMVAQLYAGQEQFDEAIVFAEQWFETLNDPRPEQLMFMANLLAQTERYERAIRYAERAVQESDSPRESWHQMLISSSFNIEDYTETARYLRMTIERWPDEPRYWEQLASIYVMLEEEALALSTLQLGWHQGVVKKENSIRSMVQMAISRGIPERAARLLEAALDQELVPNERPFLELRVNAWQTAREDTHAVAALQDLATAIESGDPYLRIANIHIERARWQDAEEALLEAQRLGVEQPGRAWLLLGIALTEQEKFQEGMEAFRNARAYGDVEDQARGWLNYAEDLRRQQNWKERNSG